MTKHSPIQKSGSLLERAAELYGFGQELREPHHGQPVGAPVGSAYGLGEPDVQDRRDNRQPKGLVYPIDRDMLRRKNFIVPEDPVTGLAEEFRIVKRQLLLAARGGKGYEPVPMGERILVCSANPNEGKTFCAINLALSIASEKDNRVLLIDADFAKADVPEVLGLPQSHGFMDALADPSVEIEDLILDTDVDGLSILPAGSVNRDDTELLASARTERLLDKLQRSDPARIVIFDSPPALAASPASVLALNVGQVAMVVRADKTNDTELTDALRLLAGCENIQLMLNAARFAPTGRRFGSYYAQGARS